MSSRQLQSFVMLFAASCVIGCGASGPPAVKKLDVVKVSGKVTVDGKPVTRVFITAHAEGDIGTKDFPNGFKVISDEEGKYKMTTYSPGDGLPPGTYGLTFVYTPEIGQKEKGKRDRVAVDKLNGKYSDFNKPTVKITVEKGKPLEVETVDLKTE